jgi:hypothetical protein
MNKPQPKASKRADDPVQPPGAFVFPTQIAALGDGAFSVKAGRPISRLTPRQLALQLGVDRDSIYRWRQEGIIPEDLVEFAGKRRLLFAAAAVDYLKRFFAARAAEADR